MTAGPSQARPAATALTHHRSMVLSALCGVKRPVSKRSKAVSTSGPGTCLRASMAATGKSDATELIRLRSLVEQSCRLDVDGLFGLEALCDRRTCCAKPTDRHGKQDHEIDTVFQTISLHDTITLTVTVSPEIVLSCDDRSLPASTDNLVYRAAEALQAHFAPDKGAHIRLVKRIPTQAGLGGGSSDGAVTLLALAYLWEVQANAYELLEIATSLGADVPFFFLGGTARGQAPVRTWRSWMTRLISSCWWSNLTRMWQRQRLTNR